MAYTDEATKIARIPCQYVEIELDHCQLTFGTAPCLATGNQCYNTYQTCKNKANYDNNASPRTTKRYGFCSNNVPLPFSTGEMPYIKSVKYLPTEIKNDLASRGKVSIGLYDDIETHDVKLDPYYSIRSTVYTAKADNKSFFKKMFGRYDNWMNTPVSIYEGYSVATNPSTVNFDRKFVGKLQTVDYSDGVLKIGIVDYLNALGDYTIPESIETELRSSITTASGKLKVRDASKFGTSGYVIIDDEVIKYSSVNTDKRQLRGLTRGAFYTVKEDHGANEKVQFCKLYSPQSPFDILKDILTQTASIATGATGYIDTAAFASIKSFPARECYFTALITKPEKADKIYKELLERTEAISWVDENQKITVARRFLKPTSVALATISDSAHIEMRSDDFSMMSEDNITRAVMYWDKDAAERKNDESSGYQRIYSYSDTLAESSLYYDSKNGATIFDRWLHTTLSYPNTALELSSSLDSAPTSTGTDPIPPPTEAATYLYSQERVAMFAQTFIKRYVKHRAYPEMSVALSLDLKDYDIKVGDHVHIDSDIMLDATGDNNLLDRWLVTRKESNIDGYDIKLTNIGSNRIGYIAEDTQQNYSSALSSQVVFGFVSSTDGILPNGDKGYVIY
jgi:hypothetical protein